MGSTRELRLKRNACPGIVAQQVAAVTLVGRPDCDIFKRSVLKSLRLKSTDYGS